MQRSNDIKTKNMKTQNLNIAKVSNKGNQFAIVAGASILAKFKTPEQAKKSLESKRGFYQYWADSVSVAVNNSKKFEVIL
jgi:hypothetical protein